MTKAYSLLNWHPDNGPDPGIDSGKIYGAWAPQTPPDPSFLRVIAQPGAKLQELALMATDHLLWSYTPTDCHIYFLAILCGLTYKDYDPRYSKNT